MKVASRSGPQGTSSGDGAVTLGHWRGPLASGLHQTNSREDPLRTTLSTGPSRRRPRRGSSNLSERPRRREAPTRASCFSCWRLWRLPCRTCSGRRRWGEERAQHGGGPVSSRGGTLDALEAQASLTSRQQSETACFSNLRICVIFFIQQRHRETASSWPRTQLAERSGGRVWRR